MTDHSTPAPYLVWSSEHRAWWGPERCGYVRSFAKAGRYSLDEAISICAKAIPGTAMQIGMLPEIPVRAADVEAMQAAFAALYSGFPMESW